MDQSEELIKEIVKANAVETYKDAAQPSIRVVGNSLAQCMSLFVTPVGRMAEIAEKNIHRYIDKIDKISPENLISPDTRILVPVLEKLRYTDDNMVADYYAEILATASDKENAKKVLVTFIEILNRLSADEIMILEYMHSKENSVEIKPVSEEDNKKYNIPIGETSANLSNMIPVVDIHLKTKDKGGYKIVKKNFNLLPEKIKLNNPENIDSYINNLVSLGLLEKPFGEKFNILIFYDLLEEHKDIQEFKKTLPKSQSLSFNQGRINITDLGLKLLELCCETDDEK